MRGRGLFGGLVRPSIFEEAPWAKLIRCNQQRCGPSPLRKGSERAAKWRRTGDGSPASLWSGWWWVGRSPVRVRVGGPPPRQQDSRSVLSVISSSKEWVLDRLPSDLPADVGAAVRGAPLRLYRAAGDSTAWGFTDFGRSIPWDRISKIHTAVPGTGSLVWVCCKDRLATLAALDILDTIIPSRRGEDPETAALRRSFSVPVHDWLRLNCNSTLSASVYIQWEELFSFLLWNLWNTRNSQFLLSKQLAAELQAALEFSSPATKRQVVVSWSPPPSGYNLKLDTGPAGGGDVVRDELRSWIFGFSLNLGSADSLIAELRAQVEFGRCTRSNETSEDALCREFEDVQGAHIYGRQICAHIE